MTPLTTTHATLPNNTAKAAAFLLEKALSAADGKQTPFINKPTDPDHLSQSMFSFCVVSLKVATAEKHVVVCLTHT